MLLRRTLLVPALVAGLLLATAATAVAYQSYGGSFSDDDGSVFEADIEVFAAEGVTKGCNPPSNTRFCPDDFVTRGQMAAFLVRALGYSDGAGDDLFTDDNSSIFEDDIDRLATAGITKGCNPPSNTRFCPDDFVTRGQMAAFLVRALGYSDGAGDDLFTDDNSSIFEDDIDRLATAGITKGCNPPSNTRFCPDDFVTRGQMAAFVSRALGLSGEDPTPFGNSTCDPAYSPCVPTKAEVGDLNCPDIRAKYPDGVLNDLSIGDPHGLNRDGDSRACEPTG